jgi:3-hydroxybutyryl-CoA dehydrogenase
MTQVAVVGAGLMGSGVAQVSAVAGYEVVLQDVSPESLERAKASITESLARFVSKERISEPEAGLALTRIHTTTDLSDVAEADIVIEAVFENLHVKTAIFSELDAICKPTAVLATNTSAIPITSIAAATSRPADVVGVHFFSPVPMMKLVELVRGEHTSDATLDVAREFAERVGKTVVVVNRDVAGFVTTRLISALTMEAIRLVESGVASAEDIDTACRLGFGHAMGPLETADLTGVDIMLNADLSVYNEAHHQAFEPPELIRQMVAEGNLGRKTGQGFYQY